MTQQVLEGLRVIALTQVWAGPLVARYLADLGADTIKIETCQRPDLIRSLMLPANDTTDRSFDHSGYFHTFNRNHRGLAVDLSRSEGREIFKTLIVGADILVENFSPRVMENWDLGYAALSQFNQRLIMVSLSGFGATGPYRDYVAYGNSIDPMTGLVDLTGYEGGPPVRSALSYPDPIAATHAAFACMAALVERERSGLGQHIDVSMLEAATVTIGETIGRFSATGHQFDRVGNHHPEQAPHSVYRCQGEDEWIAISVTSDEQWERLGRLVGTGGLLELDSLNTAAARKARERELDRWLGIWTAQRTKSEAMALLQAAGVPAGAVLTNAELLQDPHLRARDYFQELTYEHGRKFLHPGFPFRLSSTPMEVRLPGPGLGQHNTEILAELGYTADEIDKLSTDGVIGDRPSLPAAG